MCEKEYINIQNGEKLDLEKVKTLKDNSMLKVKSELWCYWDFEKNDELGLDIHKVSYGSGKKAWWICEKCKESTFQFIKNRVNDMKCNMCTGKSVGVHNSLKVINPELAKEWHPTKNAELTPDKVRSKSDKVIWWVCKLGHEWKVSPCDRSRGSGCPFCTGRKLLVGFNDLNTTHPYIAEWLINKNDGFSFSMGSSKKIDFKCYCGNIINKEIHRVVNSGLQCQNCRDGMSLGEKAIYNLLKKYNIEFEYDKATDYSEKRRYDFIINQHNMIIEVNGEQHFKERKYNFSAKARTLEEEKANDTYKRDLALKRGIINYYTLEFESMNINSLIASFNKTNISEILNLKNIDWYDISLKSQKSLIIDVCEQYNKNNEYSNGELAKLFNIERGTLVKYLKIGNKLNLCEYNKDSKKNKMLSSKNISKAVVQLSNDGNVENIFPSAREAGRILFNNANKGGGISQCCRGDNKTSHGFKWMYLNDYEDKYGKILE